MSNHFGLLDILRQAQPSLHELAWPGPRAPADHNRSRILHKGLPRDNHIWGLPTEGLTRWFLNCSWVISACGGGDEEMCDGRVAVPYSITLCASNSQHDHQTIREKRGSKAIKKKKDPAKILQARLHAASRSFCPLEVTKNEYLPNVAKRSSFRRRPFDDSELSPSDFVFVLPSEFDTIIPGHYTSCC